jgi:hypothetical protein
LGDTSNVVGILANEIDSLRKNGWYAYYDGSGTNLIPGFSSSRGIVHVIANGRLTYQYFYCTAVIGGYVARRYIIGEYGSTWSEWEYINPPMNPGHEYRTTERWNGKPVYRKLISYTTNGTIGDATKITDVDIPHGITGLKTAISCTGTNGSNLIPAISANYGATLINKVNRSYIILRIDKDTWSGTMYFELRYTKE